jgi:hypothetical protein
VSRAVLAWRLSNTLGADFSVEALAEALVRYGRPEKREEILWQIERKLAEAAVRPVLYYPVGATCRQPWVKG